MNEQDDLRRQKAVLDILKHYKGSEVYQLNKEMKERKEIQIKKNIEVLNNRGPQKQEKNEDK